MCPGGSAVVPGWEEGAPSPKGAPECSSPLTWANIGSTPLGGRCTTTSSAAELGADTRRDTCRGAASWSSVPMPRGGRERPGSSRPKRERVSPGGTEGNHASLVTVSRTPRRCGRTRPWSRCPAVHRYRRGMRREHRSAGAHVLRETATSLQEVSGVWNGLAAQARVSVLSRERVIDDPARSSRQRTMPRSSRSSRTMGL